MPIVEDEELALAIGKFSPLLYLASIAFICWLQPWVLHYLFRNTISSEKGSIDDERGARLKNAACLCVYMTITRVLGHELHETLQARNISVKPMLFIVLWYTRKRRPSLTCNGCSRK